jgi:hypothetical protein
LDAVLYVIVRVRVSVMVMVRVWGFYMGDGAVSLVSSVGGGGGFLASIATYGNTEHESVNHGQFKRKGTQDKTRQPKRGQPNRGKKESERGGRMEEEWERFFFTFSIFFPLNISYKNHFFTFLRLFYKTIRNNQLRPYWCVFLPSTPNITAIFYSIQF